MHVALRYGRRMAELDIPEERLRASPPTPQALADPLATIRQALEQPYHFPPLRRALTPGDRVTVVVDEHLPHVGSLLCPVLEHIASAGVQISDITLLCADPASTTQWVEELPEHLEEAQLEVHDPRDRKRLGYLATTRRGRRLYLNRTLIDADQAVVLTGRRYDPLLGYGGAEGALYPALADEETQRQVSRQASLDCPGDGAWPVRQEALEVAWLLGIPFFVQLIESEGDGIAQVLAGTDEASQEGARLLDATWKHTLEAPVDLVIGSLEGDPGRHTFADLARALNRSAEVVKPHGTVVLLSEARPALKSELEPMRLAEEPGFFERLARRPTLEAVPLLRWTQASQHARIYLLSALEDETVEGLSATPLEQVKQVQRLIDESQSCLLLPEAHKRFLRLQ
jgi:nickel-dependent lactate racemase